MRTGRLGECLHTRGGRTKPLEEFQHLQFSGLGVYETRKMRNAYKVLIGKVWKVWEYKEG